jgi:hypothetical protein
MFISDSSRCWHQCLPLPTIFILYWAPAPHHRPICHRIPGLPT